MSIIKASILSILFFLSLVAYGQDASKQMSVHLDVQRLNNSKVVKTVSDIYFKYVEGSMVMHYTYPMDYVMLTNRKGEAKMYVPKTNEVLIQNDQLFSSSSEVIYYFLSGKASDMGLKDEGFSMKSTRPENGFIVCEWIPPVAIVNQIMKVEIVHKNYMPVYTAVYNSKGGISKKTYYSDYYNSTQGPFPQRITEIEYLKTGDSIVSKKVYSNPKFGNSATNSYFEFKIPQNAKLVSVDKSKA